MITASPRHHVLSTTTSITTKEKASFRRRTWKALTSISRNGRLSAMFSPSKSQANDTIDRLYGPNAIYLSASYAETSPSIAFSASRASIPLTPESDLASVGHEPVHVLRGSRGAFGHRPSTSSGTNSTTLCNTLSSSSTTTMRMIGNPTINSSISVTTRPGKYSTPLDDILSVKSPTLDLTQDGTLPSLAPAPRPSRSRQALSNNHSSSHMSCTPVASTASCSTYRPRPATAPFRPSAEFNSGSERTVNAITIDTTRSAQAAVMPLQPLNTLPPSISMECLQSPPDPDLRLRHLAANHRGGCFTDDSIDLLSRHSSLEMDRSDLRRERSVSISSIGTFGRIQVASLTAVLNEHAVGASPVTDTTALHVRSNRSSSSSFLLLPPEPRSGRASSVTPLLSTASKIATSAPTSPASTEHHPQQQQHQSRLPRPICGSARTIVDIATPTSPDFPAPFGNALHGHAVAAVTRDLSESVSPLLIPPGLVAASIPPASARLSLLVAPACAPSSSSSSSRYSRVSHSTDSPCSRRWPWLEPSSPLPARTPDEPVEANFAAADGGSGSLSVSGGGITAATLTAAFSNTGLGSTKSSNEDDSDGNSLASRSCSGSGEINGNNTAETDFHSLPSVSAASTPAWTVEEVDAFDSLLDHHLQQQELEQREGQRQRQLQLQLNTQTVVVQFEIMTGAAAVAAPPAAAAAAAAVPSSACPARVGATAAKPAPHPTDVPSKPTPMPAVLGSFVLQAPPAGRIRTKRLVSVPLP
ncbi:hypothetical protein OC842_000371 [Tilletia horrida]|uniref:Uncharacterized protein n=1 Tax=Tilletia horrida TaxID=155126 RepID=A0AAN6GI87_9BASI|nr:hypothetical protein OC842_000371 [Tilletia horrida]